jgi:hypothetical protein
MENKKNKQVPTPSIRKAAKSNKVGKAFFIEPGEFFCVQQILCLVPPPPHPLPANEFVDLFLGW